MDELKAIFEELSADELLKKCVHGGTQNGNEAFHHLIWERCPKTIFVGRTKLELACYDAVLSFNEGEKGRLRFFSQLGIEPCVHAEKWARQQDSQHLVQSKQAAEPVKRARKFQSLQASRAKEELERKEGGPVYLSGAN
jgi:hypothetical protein